MVTSEKLRKELETLKFGDHLACIYKTKEEQLSTVIPFVLTGLKNNEKCIYIADENTKQEIIEAFRKVTDIDKYIKTNQLELLTKEEAYLKDGSFDPDQMIELLSRNEKKARKNGYNGLRVTGEMTWIFTKLPGVERLIEYEAKLNYFFPESKSTALCQYNEGKFNPEILLDVIHTHPTLIIYNNLYENPHFLPPDEFFARIKGEIHWNTYEKVRDGIIGRKRTEEKAKQRERERSLILDSMSEFVAYYGRDKRITWANLATVESVDAQPEEVVGKHCYEVWHCKDEPCETCPVYRAWETGMYEEGEIASPDGRIWYAKANPVFENDELAGIVVVSRDITERKKAEKDKDRILHNFDERVKELSCLYGIDEIVKRENAAVEDILKEVVRLIPPSWQYPEIAGSRITFEGTEYKTRIFKKTKWMQKADIIVNDKKVGTVEVCYTDKKPIKDEGPFIKEERNLINAIAKRLGDFFERKKVEEALKQSEEKFRSLVETTSDWVWEVDQNTTYTYASPKVKDLLGYEPEEVTGKTPFDFMPPDEAERVTRLLKDIFESQSSFAGLENTNLHKDGQHVVLETSGVPIFDAGGNFMGYRGIDRDITERKQAEEALRESEEKFRLFFENEPEYCYMISLEGKILDANKSALKILGYKKEEIIGESLLTKVYAPASRKKANLLLMEWKKTGNLRNEELNIITKEGRERTVLLSVDSVRDAHGKVLHSISVQRDITERKQAEDALRESRLQLENLFEASRLINSTMDTNRVFRFISDSIQKLVGFDNFIIFLVSEDRNRVYPVYASEGINDLVKGMSFYYGEGEIGRCMETKELLLLESASKERGKVVEMTEMNSRIVVPLITKGECVGALHLSKSTPNAYNQRDVNVLKPLGEVISSAIRNSMLHNRIRDLSLELERKVEEKSRRTEILLYARHALLAERSWERGLVTIVESMGKLGFDRCCVFLVNPMKKTLEFHFGKGVGLPERGTSVSLTDLEYFGVQCVREKKTIYVRDSRSAEGKQIVEAQSFVWVPIVVQDEAFAAIAAGNVSSEIVTEENIKDMEILAGMCAAFIDRTRVLAEPMAEQMLQTEFTYWLDPSECYIFIEKKPEKSFEVFIDLVIHGVPGFVISREYPEKVKKKYKLVKTPVLWLTRIERENTLNPEDLSKLNYIVGNFTRKSEKSVILLDGLEYLITQTNFQTVLRYLQELRDIIAMNNSRLIIPLHKGTLPLEEYNILERAFTILEPD